jgi:hypothetical protein
MKSNLIVASIAFSVVASALHAADEPKRWSKKFTMSREECSQKILKWKQSYGMNSRGWSNITNVHDYDSWRPSWWAKCTERYGQM